MDVQEILPNVLNAIGGENSFIVSFLFGAVVIAFFSRKKLEDFITPPRGEEYDFVRMMSVTSVVGGDVFQTAYLYYLVLLEFLYVFMCMSKPIILALAQIPSQDSFEGASWPLGAALLVVGLLPSSPILAQIELALRNAAYNAANIPGVFFERVTKLSQSDIEELVSTALPYKPDLERFHDLHNLLICLGIPADDALVIARRAVGADLFMQWTLKGSYIWSAGEYDKYKDILDVLKPKSEALQREVQDLIRKTKASPVVAAILSSSGAALNGQPFSDATVATIRLKVDQLSAGAPAAISAFSPGDIESWITFADLWLEKEDDLTVAIKRLSALFSIIARNDKGVMKIYKRSANGEPVAPGTAKVDPVLKQLFDLLDDRAKPNLWYNTSLLSNIAGFAFCFAILSIYLYFIDPLLFGAIEGESVAATIKTSLFTSANLFLSFVIATLTALSLRAVRKKNDNWIMFRDLATFPFVQYVPIIAVSALASFMPQIVNYIVYYYSSGQLNDISQQSQGFLAETIVFKALWTLVPVSFAVGICVLSDVIERNQQAVISATLPLCISAMVVFVAFILLSLNADYPISGGAFWHNIVSSWLFAFSGLLTYQSSLKAART